MRREERENMALLSAKKERRDDTPFSASVLGRGEDRERKGPFLQSSAEEKMIRRSFQGGRGEGILFWAFRAGEEWGKGEKPLLKNYRGGKREAAASTDNRGRKKNEEDASLSSVPARARRTR